MWIDYLRDITKIVNIYLSIKWYAPGAEFERPARVNRSRREPPRCGARPDTPPLVNGFWNECFFNIVFIKISVSNFGMLLTTELTSSSLICTRRQFSSSVGRILVLLFVTHGCSFWRFVICDGKNKKNKKKLQIYLNLVEYFNGPESFVMNSGKFINILQPLFNLNLWAGMVRV